MQHPSGKWRPLTLLRILVVNKNHYKGKLYEQNWQGNDMKLRRKNLKNKELHGSQFGAYREDHLL